MAVFLFFEAEEIILLIVTIFLYIIVIMLTIEIAGWILEIMQENVVQIVIEIPKFEYDLTNAAHFSESGSHMFDIFAYFRNLAVPILIFVGALCWILKKGIGVPFGFKLVVKDEVATTPIGKTASTFGGTNYTLMGNALGKKIKNTVESGKFVGLGQNTENAKEFTVGDGKESGIFDYQTTIGGLTFTDINNFLNTTLKKCVVGILILLILPIVWDIGVDIASNTSLYLLNPIYSGNVDRPCPPEWYKENIFGELYLNRGHPDAKTHFEKNSHFLYMWDDQEDGYDLYERACLPNMRVAFVLELWGGETKVVARPPSDDTITFFDLMFEIGAGAVHEFDEWFTNIMLSVLKAEYVLMQGPAFIVASLMLDMAMSIMLVATPILILLALVPWGTILNQGGASQFHSIMRDFAPTAALTTLAYPIQFALLFFISSEVFNALIWSFESELGKTYLAFFFGQTVVSMGLVMPALTAGIFKEAISQMVDLTQQSIQTARMMVEQTVLTVGTAGAGVAMAGIKTAGVTANFGLRGATSIFSKQGMSNFGSFAGSSAKAGGKAVFSKQGMNTIGKKTMREMGSGFGKDGSLGEFTTRMADYIEEYQSEKEEKKKVEEFQKKIDKMTDSNKTGDIGDGSTDSSNNSKKKKE